MEQEFYYEESNPKKIKILCVILIIIVALLFGIFMHYKNKYTLNVKKSVIYEVGDKLSYNIEDYVLNEIVDKSDYSINFKGLTNDEILNKVGEYTFEVEYKNISKKGKVIVEDTTAPSVEVTDLVVGVNEEFELDDLIVSCEDYSMPCRVEYKDSSDENIVKKTGKYDIEIVISDNHGNKVTKETTIEVRKNYSLLSKKKKDLNVDHIVPDYDDWEGQMIIKYDEGIDPNVIEESDEEYPELLEILSNDLHQYIDELYVNNLITETETIEVYNKYDFIIGYAIRIKLDNGLYLYLTR